MLRNHGECYCELTHILLQIYDNMSKKAHGITFHFRITRVLARIQSNYLCPGVKRGKTKTDNHDAHQAGGRWLKRSGLR